MVTREDLINDNNSERQTGPSMTVIIGIIAAVAVVGLLVLVVGYQWMFGQSTQTAASAFPVKSIKITGPRYPTLATNTVIAGLAERRIVVDPNKPGAEITGEVLVSTDEGTKKREIVVVFAGTYNGLQVSGRGIAVATNKETDGQLVEIASRDAVDGLKDQFAAQNVSFEKPTPSPAPAPSTNPLTPVQ